jgi:surface protein
LPSPKPHRGLGHAVAKQPEVAKQPRKLSAGTVFTTKTFLQTAVQAYNANVASAIVTYGPIADWDVSGITDMSRLFIRLKNFDADISSWDTSSVTDMNLMFYVRFRLRLLPTLPSWATHARRVRC